MNTIHAPMLGAVRSGDAPGESSWDRQDFVAGFHQRSRFDRRYKVVARRGLRRAENVRITGEILAEKEAAAREAIELADLNAALDDAIWLDDEPDIWWDDELDINALQNEAEEEHFNWGARVESDVYATEMTTDEVNEAGGFIVTHYWWYGK